MKTIVRFAGFAILLILAMSCRRTAEAPLASAPAGMASTADLKDKRIGVVMGSVYDGFAAKTYPRAAVLQFESASDLQLAVLTGKVDAGLGDEQPLVEILRTNGNLAMFGEPVLKLPLGAGFRKGSTELRDAFNRFLSGIRQNGVHAEMVDRWLKRHEMRMPAIPSSPTSGVLVVGVSAGGLPFGALQDGRYVGFDIEMVERFAASIGKEVRFSQMPFGALIAANATGKVDMVVASMFITEERQKRIDFSDPYFETPGRAYALKSKIAAGPAAAAAGGRPRLTSIDDLRDKRIAVQLGTVYDIYAAKTFPAATVVQFNSFQEVTLAVSAGKADAGLIDIDTFVEVQRANNDLVVFGNPIFKSPVAAGFAKSSAGLRASFNAFLKNIRDNGTHADMADRWMKRSITTMPNIPSSSANGTLLVGISSGGFPFAAVQDGQLAGFDIELARRFAAYIGKEPRMVDQDFGALIPALASGKIEIIIADMFDTEERRKQIDFSDPYFEQDSVAFTRAANTMAEPQAAGPAGRVPSFFDQIAASFHSNIIAERRYLLLWDGFKATALISIFSAFFGTALGALVCYLRMSPLTVLNAPARLYIAVLRGTPIVVLLMIIFYVVFGSVDVNPIVVAVIAFGMNFAAYVSEMFRAGIESIDKGQREGGIAMGFTPAQTFAYILLPQMVQRTLPVYKGELISLVKMTSVVGYIAVQDLTKASDIIRSRTFDAFFPLIMVAVLYFLIAWGLMHALQRLERWADPKLSRRKAASR